MNNQVQSLPPHPPLQIFPPQLLRKPLDGVAEHGAGHGPAVLFEELLFLLLPAAFADLTEHPADGLVNEVVAVVHEHLRDLQGLRELALLDVAKGRYYRLICGHITNLLRT